MHLLSEGVHAQVVSVRAVTAQTVTIAITAITNLEGFSLGQGRLFFYSGFFFSLSNWDEN